MYKNYDDIDDNYNSVPALEIAIKRWTPFKEIKNKKLNSFLFPRVNPINYIKKASANTCLQKQRKTRSKQKLIKPKNGFQKSQGKS